MNLQKNILTLSVAALVGFSCSSGNKLTKTQKSTYGEEQFQVCSREVAKIKGDKRYFTGIGEGRSINSQYSKKAAREEARNELAEKMNVFVRTETKNEEQQAEDPTSYAANRAVVTEQLVSQRLQGLSTFCEKTFRNDEGVYTSFVGVKLDIEKSHFLKEVKEKLKKEGI